MYAHIYGLWRNGVGVVRPEISNGDGGLHTLSPPPAAGPAAAAAAAGAASAAAAPSLPACLLRRLLAADDALAHRRARRCPCLTMRV